MKMARKPITLKKPVEDIDEEEIEEEIEEEQEEEEEIPAPTEPPARKVIPRKPAPKLKGTVTEAAILRDGFYRYSIVATGRIWELGDEFEV